VLVGFSLLVRPFDAVGRTAGVNVEGAQELAAALLKTAQLMEDAPIVGKLN
jgi:hypothetical protein